MASTAAPIRSQLVPQANSQKATSAGKVSAEEIAQVTFDGIGEQRFYIYSHPQALTLVQERFDAMLGQRNPGDPFAGRPDVRARLINDLRG